MDNTVAGDNVVVYSSFFDVYNNSVFCNKGGARATLSHVHGAYETTVDTNDKCAFVFVQVTISGSYSLTVAQDSLIKQVCCTCP